MNTSVVVQWGEGYTNPIKATRGLRQGCPLSPLLFMLYMAGMQGVLEERGLGLGVSYGEEGAQVVQRIPALIYADDIVLLAESLEELQGLLDVCGKEGTRLGLDFNASKSGVLRMDVEPVEAQELESASISASQMVTIQGQNIDWKCEYKYLGVTLGPGRHYMERHA